MSKNKFFLTIAASFLVANIAISQTLRAKFFRNNSTWEFVEDYGVCPETNIQYEIIGWNDSCHTMNIVNGFPAGDVTDMIQADGRITINWQNNGDSCKIVIGKIAGQACSAKPTRTFFIPVLSIAKVKPTITQTPAGKPTAGFTHKITYKATAYYPWIGKKDSMNLAAFKLDQYQWTVPLGWTITAGNQTQFETIEATTNLGTGGAITARVYNRACSMAGLSDIGTITTLRAMPSPCPITPVNQVYELCGQPIQNTFNCAPLPNNFAYPSSGVTWEWSVSPAPG